MNRDERNQSSALQELRIGDVHRTCSAVKSRPQLRKRLAEAAEVGEVRSRNNVEILRRADVSVRLHGDPSDHDEVHAVLAEHAEDLLRVEDRHPPLRAARPATASRLRSG